MSTPTTRQNLIRQPLSTPGVVAIVDSPRAATLAKRLPKDIADFLEWRADHLGTAIFPARLPWIITARHPSEGGAGALATAARRSMLESLLPHASIIDIEIRSLTPMRTVAANARKAGVKILASFHDFKKTPSAAALDTTARKALDAGADLLKVATTAHSPSDIANLLTLIDKQRLPTAVMAMGPLGMASRPLFAAAGSLLNYGWLDKPNVPGQWSARDLATLIARCLPRPSSR